MANEQFREPQQAAREKGLAQRHVTRQERAIRREERSEGRKEGLEEALRYVETEARWQVELLKRHQRVESVQRLNVIANCIRDAVAREIGSREAGE